MQPTDKIKLYQSLFRGRNDAFARRWDKNGSYFPDYTFDWNEFNAHKASGGTIKDFQNKQLTPFGASLQTQEPFEIMVLGKEDSVL